MPDLLDSVNADIRRRLTELAPLVEEHDQLQNALVALNGQSVRDVAGRGDGGAQRGRKAPQPRRGGKRAPRGSTQGAVTDYLAEHDSATAGEIASSMGLSRTSVAATLSKLVKTGTLAKAERGYRLA